MDLPQIEEKILKVWRKKKIFEKSLKRNKDKKRFVFFEGPPTANGMPGLHHVEARAFKDVLPRYKTMRGFLADRKAGWDTHGLPVEIEVEKELGLKSKKEIEKYGLAKFNEKCRESVWKYKNEWEKITERIAFWVDMKDPYITYENDYIESVWWIVKQIWDKGLLYKDYKVVHYCPRCGTPLSSHEVAQGYKTVKEASIYFKLPIKADPASFFLVWTTTPWTLPANVAIAVGENITYVKARVGEEKYILAKERLAVLNESYEIESEFLGGTLVGQEYEPLYEIKLDKPGYKVIPAEFVSTEDGTGIVHIAPAFGVEDMEAGRLHDLPVLMTVDEAGNFKEEVKQWAGQFVKDADPSIIADLKKRELLFREEMYEHEYPFCWRCHTPLLYYAKTSWFIKMTALREELLENNAQINWVPEHLKGGRFGEWLKEVKDWTLSRDRFWGTPLPIWECEKCHEIKVVGSVKEFKKKLRDLHKPFIDEVVFECPKCGGQMNRVSEVMDCWFDSGSMPFAQWHYPFANKNKIDDGEAFPADFISEGIDQTRGWFYTLLAISTLLGKGPAYKNVISVGHLLDAKGLKMSKSKGNIVEPMAIISEFGADTVRWYLYTVNQAGDPKRFDIKDVKDKYNRFFGTLFNVYLFFKTYTEKSFKPQKLFQPQNILDKWILSLLNSLIAEVSDALDKYDVVGAARAIENFVGELSNWFVRRSRRRFQKPENKSEKNEASQTLYFVLLTLSKLAAPFIPFLSEEIYLGLKKSKMPESVHLADWPVADKKAINKSLEAKMAQARAIVVLALAERALAGIKVRQPLAGLTINNKQLAINNKELVEIIKDEINVKEVIFDETLKDQVKLDKKITKELKEEGWARELTRQIQEMRKEAGLTRKDIISIAWHSTDKSLASLMTNWAKYFERENLAQEVIAYDKKAKYLLAKEMKLGEGKIRVAIK
ncbi:isoleucine--tRNA ligase [Patescibacteria group bacterium]|nr:isoleucine--tRNA ligase [Patescibacteria group bacterium]